MIVIKLFLYAFSDVSFVLLYYVFRYRRKVVLYNLRLAFPNYKEKHIRKIKKEFYKNLVDLFFETIIMSVSNSNYVCSMMKKNFDSVSSHFKSSIENNKNIILLSGHLINWELVNAMVCLPPIYKYNLCFYLPIKNYILNKYMLWLRTKFGNILLSVYNISKDLMRYKHKKVTLCFLADQRPFNPKKSFWVDFFNIKTPFIKEPERCAKVFNADPYFFEVIKIKRGQYELKGHIIEYDKNITGSLTQAYAKKMEEAITRSPALYLWTHKRWKYKFENYN